MTYTKNLKGVCEEDEYGIFDNQEDCQAGNQVGSSSEIERFIILEVVANDFERILSLAPSDRSRVLEMTYGLRIPPEESYQVADSIYTDDWFRLYFQYSDLAGSYLDRNLDEFDIFILEVHRPMKTEILEALMPWNLKRIRANVNNVFRNNDSGLLDPETLAFEILDYAEDTLPRVSSHTRNERRLAMLQQINDRWDVIERRYSLE